MQKINPDLVNRRSIRLKNYNYSQVGFYFVTICTQNHAKYFGEINKGVMELNDAGKMICRWYEKLEQNFSNVKNDVMIVMPNHIHFITQIHHVNNTNTQTGEHTGSPLHKIIQWFKTMTTNEYIKHVKTGAFPPFEKRLWQRNYWEHIIRNEKSYHDIIQYIENNPANWDLDEYTQ